MTASDLAAPAPIRPMTRLAIPPEELLPAVQTLVAVVLSLLTAVLLRQVAGLSAQAPILAVTLALTLRRVPLDGVRPSIEAAFEVPLVALAAAGSGWLLVHESWIGQPLLVIGLSVGILARRFGPLARRAGRLVALPFLALLIAPVMPTHGSELSAMLWAPVLAEIALAWTVLAGVAGRSLGVPQHTVAAAAPGPTVARAARRLDAPTRMALQMATGLTAALVLGHLLFGDRWEWTLLSAFLVASGNRGRGDVVHKAGLRILGASAGTVVATAIGVGVPRGHLVVIAVLFAVMAVSLVLRSRSYAWWAAGVTAMVALLHAYYGETGADLVGERLLGVLVGSATGVAVAWFVTPIRTRDVFRHRVADCLAALTDDLAPDAVPSTDSYPAALARLDELTPTLRGHRRVSRWLNWEGPHPEDAVVALHALAPLPTDPRARQRLRRDVVRVRRAMIGRDDPSAEELPAAVAAVHRVLRAHAEHRKCGHVRAFTDGSGRGSIPRREAPGRG
jgi:hypothetical protein